jgi:hypothetical protein
MTMSPPKPITLDELQRELPLNEWESWLQSRLAHFGSTREGLAYKRFNSGPMKVVKEEIIPTLLLLERRFKGEDIFVAFSADNNSAADAFIRPASAANATPLQITCNLDHDDHLRLQILHRDGMVPGAGPITRVGGRLEAEGRAYFTEEVVAEIAGTIIDRLNSKARKFANYDPSTWLLVYIDDARLPMKGLPILLETIRNDAAESPFVATFLVGSHPEHRICELIGGTAKWVS